MGGFPRVVGRCFAPHFFATWYPPKGCCWVGLHVLGVVPLLLRLSCALALPPWADFFADGCVRVFVGWVPCWCGCRFLATPLSGFYWFPGEGARGGGLGLQLVR